MYVWGGGGGEGGRSAGGRERGKVEGEGGSMNEGGSLKRRRQIPLLVEGRFHG